MDGAELEQSFLRTKARDYKSYWKTMELQANSSNNTIFADADGDIAYFHGNYIPRRDTSFDWTKPVVDETPHLLNPKSGWLYNSNNWPWSGAGLSSLKKEDYPGFPDSPVMRQLSDMVREAHPRSDQGVGRAGRSDRSPARVGSPLCRQLHPHFPRAVLG